MTIFRLRLVLAALLAVGVAACSSSEPTISEAPSGGEATSAEDEALEPVSLNAKQLEQIELLPEDQQDAAIAQSVCPISGAPLGSMGVPIALSLEGGTVFLCCAGCEDSAMSDPEGTLAKVAALKAASAAKAEAETATETETEAETADDSAEAEAKPETNAANEAPEAEAAEGDSEAADEEPSDADA